MQCKTLALTRVTWIVSVFYVYTSVQWKDSVHAYISAYKMRLMHELLVEGHCMYIYIYTCK